MSAERAARRRAYWESLSPAEREYVVWGDQHPKVRSLLFVINQEEKFANMSGSHAIAGKEILAARREELGLPTALIPFVKSDSSKLESELDTFFQQQPLTLAQRELIRLANTGYHLRAKADFKPS